jgi:hypothetical protein
LIFAATIRPILSAQSTRGTMPRQAAPGQAVDGAVLPYRHPDAPELPEAAGSQDLQLR